MSDYTPTLDVIASHYCNERSADNYQERMAYEAKRRVEFDRAIAKVRAEAKAEALESVRSLIQDLTGNDDDPCQFDHHGGCQAHGYLTLEPGELCPQEEAKRWLRACADKLVTE